MANLREYLLDHDEITYLKTDKYEVVNKAYGRTKFTDEQGEIRYLSKEDFDSKYDKKKYYNYKIAFSRINFPDDDKLMKRKILEVMKDLSGRTLKTY